MDPQKAGSRGIMLPGGLAYINGQLRADAPSDEARLNQGDIEKAITGDTHAFWITGRVTYRDVFGEDRWTTFRYIMTKRKGQSIVMTACADGNDGN